MKGSLDLYGKEVWGIFTDTLPRSLLRLKAIVRTAIIIHRRSFTHVPKHQLVNLSFCPALILKAAVLKTRGLFVLFMLFLTHI
jgi:hypothetical protein